MDKYSAIFILNKETFKINGNLKDIYCCIDFSFGEIHPNYMIPIVGRYKGEKIKDYVLCDHKLCAMAVDFSKSSEMSNTKYDLEGCLIKMRGLFCNEFFESYDQGLHLIENETIIAEAKKKFHVKDKKEFNESSMDDNSDISKLYKDIRKTIISQDEQIMMILTSLFKNQRVINSSLSEDVIRKLKENILIAGPTGTGKTEILTRISKKYNVPIVIADSTSLSEVGYQGRNVEDLLRDLYLEADSDLEKAEKGILVIDEFDKLAEKSKQDMVSRSGVQRSLLKILDGGKIYFDGMSFDTSKLTIVGLGAFSGIKAKQNYQNISTDDLVEYGVMQELVGRFSKVIKMNSLSKEDLKKILLESDLSPLHTYKGLFDELGVSFDYDDKFVDYIAEKAEMLDTGARSLKTIFDEQISGALFNIFAGDYKAIALTSPGDDGISYTLKKTKDETKKGLFGKRQKK